MAILGCPEGIPCGTAAWPYWGARRVYLTNIRSSLSISCRPCENLTIISIKVRSGRLAALFSLSFPACVLLQLTPAPSLTYTPAYRLPA